MKEEIEKKEIEKKEIEKEKEGLKKLEITWNYQIIQEKGKEYEIEFTDEEAQLFLAHISEDLTKHILLAGDDAINCYLEVMKKYEEEERNRIRIEWTVKDIEESSISKDWDKDTCLKFLHFIKEIVEVQSIKLGRDIMQNLYPDFIKSLNKEKRS